ncbi:hypothetical protein NUACC21_62780 [Scytonema sp. NUACC21]
MKEPQIKERNTRTALTGNTNNSNVRVPKFWKMARKRFLTEMGDVAGFADEKEMDCVMISKSVRKNVTGKGRPQSFVIGHL